MCNCKPFDVCFCEEIDPRTDAQIETDSILASCPPAEVDPFEAFELDAWEGVDYAVEANLEAAETNLWLAEQYAANGATALAEECRQAATAQFAMLATVSLFA